METSGATPDRTQLTTREQEVAALVCKGLTNRQVASRLRLSLHTVNFHLRNIFRKLGLDSRVELTAYLYRRRAQ